MRINKIIFLILLIIWMTIVFMFSHQPAEISSNTSGNTIEYIINTIPFVKDFSEQQKQEIIEVLQPIVRKLAHLSIYAVGGMLLFAFVNTYNIEEKSKIIISIFSGITYSIIDEIHQLLIPR